LDAKAFRQQTVHWSESGRIEGLKRIDVQNCNLTIQMDPQVPEIWVWADSNRVEAKEKGEGLSKEELEKYNPEGIKNHCE
jgi:hypothetical protein